MRQGDVIRTTYFLHHQGGAREGWKAPKGKVFVAVMLGVEDKGGSDPINLKDAFNDLGWIPNPEDWTEEGLEKLESQ